MRSRRQALPTRRAPHPRERRKRRRGTILLVLCCYALSTACLALGYARSIVVDIGYVLEGKTEAQLPESIMGAVRIKNIDMAAAVKLPPAPTTP